MTKTCSASRCDQVAHARTWCSKHYGRWRRWGAPNGLAPARVDGFVLDDPEQAAMPSPVDLAWVAGILEGEGCFFLTTRKNKDGTPRPLLSVICSMTDEDVIRRLHRTIGTGGVSTRTRVKEGYAQQWTWSDSNVERVVPLITALRPLMGIRRSAKIGRMLAAADGWTRLPMREHGSLVRYQRGCRCALCRGANAKAHREYLAQRALQVAA